MEGDHSLLSSDTLIGKDIPNNKS